MNERIKELEKQSVFYNDDDNFYFDRVVFAELIVRECAEKCVYVVDRQEILAHFGVDNVGP